MDLSVKYTYLEVDDHEAALAFYRDALGLEVHEDVGGSRARWVTVGPASQPDRGIVLVTVGVGRPPEDEQTLRELLAKGSLSGAVFETDDVDATFEAVRATGAEVLQEPVDQPYGIRDCGFRDPSGNQIRFHQRAKE
jgi:predicted enzyme related to lactoylglutathione lyase